MRKILAICLTALMAFAFVGCSKDNKDDNASLMGSKWVCTIEQTITEDVEGVSVTLRTVNEQTLSFNTKNNCTIRHKTILYTNGKSTNEESSVTPATYSYDGKSKGEITTTQTNEETGETISTKYSFSIAGDKLSLTPENDSEGVGTTVFKRQ